MFISGYLLEGNEITTLKGIYTSVYSLQYHLHQPSYGNNLSVYQEMTG